MEHGNVAIRFAEQVALAVIDAAVEQEVDRFFVFDHFRHGLDLEILAQIDDGLEDVLAGRVGEGFAHVTAVDLDHVDLKLPEMLQRRLADSEIIETDLMAGRSHGLDRLVGRPQVVDPLRLGYLEEQLTANVFVLAQPVNECRDEAFIADRLGGKVDGERECPIFLVARPQVVDGHPAHGHVEVFDQTQVFGLANELEGRSEFAVDAREDLVVVRLPGAELDDRLESHGEGLGTDRAFDSDHVRLHVLHQARQSLRQIPEREFPSRTLLTPSADCKDQGIGRVLLLQAHGGERDAGVMHDDAEPLRIRFARRFGEISSQAGDIEIGIVNDAVSALCQLRGGALTYGARPQLGTYAGDHLLVGIRIQASDELGKILEFHEGQLTGVLASGAYLNQVCRRLGKGLGIVQFGLVRAACGVRGVRVGPWRDQLEGKVVMVLELGDAIAGEPNRSDAFARTLNADGCGLGTLACGHVRQYSPGTGTVLVDHEIDDVPAAEYLRGVAEQAPGRAVGKDHSKVRVELDHHVGPTVGECEKAVAFAAEPIFVRHAVTERAR